MLEEGSVHPSSSRVVCRSDDAACDALDRQLSASWLRIGIAAVFAGQGMMFSLALNMTPPPYGSTPYWILHGGLIFSSLVVMAFLGLPLFRSTFGMLRSRRLSIEGLFTLSLLGAFIGSVVGSVTGAGDVFYEVVSIVIAIYTFGRMLSERSMAKLLSETERMREHFDRATVLCEGTWVDLPLSELCAGSRVRVEPGAAFTVDGVVCTGMGYVQDTALTGEPLPVVRRKGDRVRAGTWSVDGSFEIEAEQVLGERELDTILEDLESASARSSELQSQANELIQGFLPFVVGASFATAIYWSFMGSWIDAVLNSMAVLLVACPCALGLATPVAIAQGLFRLSQMGLVSRDGALVDALARTKLLFFDKTGTLSEASMRVTELYLDQAWESKRAELLAAVRALEAGLEHPVAFAVVRYLDGLGVERVPPLSERRLIPGAGVLAEVDLGGTVCLVQVGELSLAKDASSQLGEVSAQLHTSEGKRIYIFVNGALVGAIVLQEPIREGVPSLWAALEARGLCAKVLTGDPSPQLPLPKSVAVASNLSSADKERWVSEAKEAGDFPVLVGDGINDAVAMARASGSIAMQSGAGLARSAAMGQISNIAVLPQAIDLARSIRARLKGNLVYAAGYNLIGIILAASGWLHPVAAALIMLISSFAVTARALSGKSVPNAMHRKN